MADKQARRTDEVLKNFKDRGAFWSEEIVVVNPDGSPISAGGGGGSAVSGTGTLTNVANAVASTQLLAANAERIGATIYNDDAGATLKVKLGTTASATSFTVPLGPGDYYEVPYGYTGRIDGIASAATGTARITEMTA